MKINPFKMLRESLSTDVADCSQTSLSKRFEKLSKKENNSDLHISQKTISKIETDPEANASKNTLIAYHKLFNVSYEFLLGEVLTYQSQEIDYNKQLKLTDSSIAAIEKFNENELYVFNSMLSNNAIKNIIYNIIQYSLATADPSLSISITYRGYNKDRSDLAAKDILRYPVIRELERILDDFSSDKYFFKYCQKLFVEELYRQKIISEENLRIMLEEWEENGCPDGIDPNF